MAKLVIFSKEQIEERYPIGSSLMAMNAQKAIKDGHKVALIQNYTFNNDFKEILDVCNDVLKRENPRYSVVTFVDVTDLEEEYEVVVAFKEE